MKKVIAVEYHRNGISGQGFYVITFTEDGKNMVGVVFPSNGHIAVFDRELLGDGVIAFGVNSFRGDYYEGFLRNTVKEYEQEIYNN